LPPLQAGLYNFVAWGLAVMAGVFDFVFWKGQLIFATGNGLYISKPGSNAIRCILSEPDLLFFSLCPLNNRMYVGTSNGLYYLKTDHFIGL